MNVLVIGGTGGIGEAVVRRFASQGASVLFTYLKSGDSASRLVDELAGQGGDVRASQLDLRSEDGIIRVVGEAKRPMDAVVLSAASGARPRRVNPRSNSSLCSRIHLMSCIAEFFPRSCPRRRASSTRQRRLSRKCRA